MTRLEFGEKLLEVFFRFTPERLLPLAAFFSVIIIIIVKVICRKSIDEIFPDSCKG